MKNSKASVLLEVKSHVAFITLNNPEDGNVVNNNNLILLKKFLEDSIKSDNCRCIVLQGKDGVFCRGMDFKNLIKQANEKINLDFSEPYKNVVKLIRNSPKPIVAYIDGDVLAGGMGIMLACDIIIASDRSKFGLSEVLFGIIPAYVFPLLFERVSYKKARFLILSSKRFNADNAFEYGIIDEVVPEDKMKKKLKEYLQRLLFSSPDALALTKQYSDQLTENKMDELLNTAQKQLTELLNNETNIKAINDFLQGDTAPWAVSYKPKKS